ncbi:uncharacterized protein H6S33_006499 [Morchella sextelata]|uniref:uncharacterized protein n=1 Tax=Morchella sextelata TaxID=1174677 RepID=UPI001D03F29B|nr:uncharacterized protein H6S33_006499 [Morchella sextelata]KAH0604831.1 hypothetical protein H6S33_006499 [Morchella sextelata]
MPCGNSTQVFAFTTLSPTSQLSLASSMTTAALLDFAAASPAFMIFLRTHCEEVVLAALKTQYGYIPEKSTWSCGLLPLYENLPPHVSDTPLDNSTPRSAYRSSIGRYKRGNQDTARLLQEMPVLQWLVDEEQLSDNGRKLLDILPLSDHSQGLYYAGVRGLVRYCQKYTALCSSVVTKREINEQMQRWLQERYTPWGINEMWFVVDALGSRIDEIMPSLRNDETRREKLLGMLLCKMDVLRLFSGYDFASSSPTSEGRALRRLLEEGIIEEALLGKPINSSSRRQSRTHSRSYSTSWSSEDSPNNYIFGYGNNHIASQGVNLDQLQERAERPREPRPSVFGVACGPIGVL